jgi:hypothetical protein
MASPTSKTLTRKDEKEKKAYRSHGAWRAGMRKQVALVETGVGDVEGEKEKRGYRPDLGLWSVSRPKVVYVAPAPTTQMTSTTSTGKIGEKREEV